MITIQQVKQGFLLAFTNIIDHQFSKTHGFHGWNERDLLPHMRFFLLGYFGRIEPEFRVKLPTSDTGKGVVDFLIGTIPVEFAVRSASAGSHKISVSGNKDEILKLMKYQGDAALVLYDFSSSPLTFRNLVKDYKNHHPHTGTGHRMNPYWLIYCFMDENGEAVAERAKIKIPK